MPRVWSVCHAVCSAPGTRGPCSPSLRLSPRLSPSFGLSLSGRLTLGLSLFVRLLVSLLLSSVLSLSDSNPNVTCTYLEHVVQVAGGGQARDEAGDDHGGHAARQQAAFHREQVVQPIPLGALVVDHGAPPPAGPATARGFTWIGQKSATTFTSKGM